MAANRKPSEGGSINTNSFLAKVENRIKSCLIEHKLINTPHYIGGIYLHDNVGLHHCKKEPFTAEWIGRYFKEGDIVFDVGANVGVFTILMARKAKIVYAFEPAFLCFSTLIKNLAANKVLDKVIPIGLAVGKTGTTTLCYSSNAKTPGSWGVTGGYTDKPTWSHQAMMVSLDKFCQDYNISPTCLKVDVDGNEFEILKGAEKTLASVRHLLTEVGEGEEQRVLDYLAKFGFSRIHRLSLGDNRCNLYLEKSQATPE